MSEYEPPRCPVCPECGRERDIVTRELEPRDWESLAAGWRVYDYSAQCWVLADHLHTCCYCREPHALSCGATLAYCPEMYHERARERESPTSRRESTRARQ